MSTITRLIEAFSTKLDLDPALVTTYARRLQESGVLPRGVPGGSGRRAPRVDTGHATSLLLAILGSDHLRRGFTRKEAAETVASFSRLPLRDCRYALMATAESDHVTPLPLAAGSDEERLVKGILTEHMAELGSAFARFNFADCVRSIFDLSAPGPWPLSTVSLERLIGEPSGVVQLSGRFPAIDGDPLGTGETMGVFCTLVFAASDIAAGKVHRDDEDAVARGMFHPGVVSRGIKVSGVILNQIGDMLGHRSLYGAIARAVHKRDRSGTDLVIKKSDDSTTLVTDKISTTAGVEPVVGVDPPA